MFANFSVCLVLFVQQSKRCLLHLGIIQGVFQKILYVHVVPYTSTVLFAERTFGGPHAYVHAKNNGIHPLDLTYIRPQKISVWFLFSKRFRFCWVNTKGLGLC
jgi:hypothetical protein